VALWGAPRGVALRAESEHGTWQWEVCVRWRPCLFRVLWLRLPLLLLPCGPLFSGVHRERGRSKGHGGAAEETDTQRTRHGRTTGWRGGGDFELTYLAQLVALSLQPAHSL
jgi:hypothetical protein